MNTSTPKYLLRSITFVLVLVAQLAFSNPVAAADSHLKSWNDGEAKTAIIKFVDAVTKEGGPDYVKPEERIAVFDNDGTLWCEQPTYPQVIFISMRAKQMEKDHPELKDNSLFQAALQTDLSKLCATGAKGTQELNALEHAMLSTDQFEEKVDEWTKTAKHPRFQQPYTSCVYKPMLEVLAYLKSKGFTNYIVSGGGMDFIRPWSEPVYNIPPERVIGSTCKTKFQDKDGKATIVRLPEIEFVCDRANKAVAIERVIGRRPIAAFGNSNGDLEMLQYTTAGSGKRLGLLVHHTDAEREYAYDRNSKVGRLDKALDEAQKENWIVVDMKKDWKKVFSFEK